MNRCRIAAEAFCVTAVLTAACSGGGANVTPTASPQPTLSATMPPLPTQTPPSPTAAPTAVPSFHGAARQSSDAERAAMRASGSWREGCPVAIDDLRVLELSFWGFDGAVSQGLLMVNADVASSVIEAFHGLFDARFPIHRMELVDNFGADDEQSMLADNTSAYNCRGIPGSSAWSQHAYGRAVDINPFENPEVRAGAVDPPQAARFADRSLTELGMIHTGDAAVSAFSNIGWSWGGYWDEPKDYQHFSLTGN